MSTYLRLRAVPPPALRNSTAWLERLFEEDSEAVRHRVGRHTEESLGKRYLDQQRIYAAAPPHPVEDGPQAQVVLGGRPVFRTERHKPPFLVLTSAQARRVASFLARADFDALWDFARAELLPHYGGVAAEPETWQAFAAAHRELKAFYAQTAECGDAVVKWLPVRGETSTGRSSPRVCALRSPSRRRGGA